MPAESKSESSDALPQEAFIPQPARSCVRGAIVLSVYCWHNAWNCWTFLNACSAEEETKTLLSIGEEEVGMLNTAGLIGIAGFLPLATVCKWPRTLLCFGAGLNIVAPVLRFFGAKAGNYYMVLASFAGTGMAFGVLGIWPTVLSVTFFSEQRHVLTTAMGTLSNWLGGAAASVLTPALTGKTSHGLLTLLQVQLYISGVLAAVTISWLWIPCIENASISLSEEFYACSRLPVALRIISFAIVAGVATALQNVNPILFGGVGFSEDIAGVANCVFQLAGAILGISVGTFVTCRHRLSLSLKWFHAIASTASVGIFVFCWAVNTQGPIHDKDIILVAIVTVQGAAITGLLPLVAQQAVYVSHPASEKFVSGLLLTIAILLSASLNQISASISPLNAFALIVGITCLQGMFFAWHESRLQLDDSRPPVSGRDCAF